MAQCSGIIPEIQQHEYHKANWVLMLLFVKYARESSAPHHLTMQSIVQVFEIVQFGCCHPLNSMTTSHVLKSPGKHVHFIWNEINTVPESWNRMLHVLNLLGYTTWALHPTILANRCFPAHQRQNAQHFAYRFFWFIWTWGTLLMKRCTAKPLHGSKINSLTLLNQGQSHIFYM